MTFCGQVSVRWKQASGIRGTLMSIEEQVARIAKNASETTRLNLTLMEAVRRQANTSLIATKKKLSLRSSPNAGIANASPK